MGSSLQYSEARRRQQWRERRSRSIHKKHWRLSIKRNASTRSPKRPTNVVKRRIRTLKKLVPNGKSNGLEALFAEAAEYIKCLQMEVNIMQIMVKLLSQSD